MDACGAVDIELDRVLAKFQSFNNQSSVILEDMIQKILDLKSEIDDGKPFFILFRGGTYSINLAVAINTFLQDTKQYGRVQNEKIDLMKSMLKKVSSDLQRMLTQHRDLHSSVSKIGKAIDRNYCSDFAANNRFDIFSVPDKVNLLNRVVCEHFYRLGMKDIADELAEEASVNCSDFDQAPFLELNYILDCLKQRDLDPALKWSETNREKLEKQNSALEFKLHRLRFISIIEKGSNFQTDAIIYARTHFKQFVKKHEKEIQNLMGMFLYLPNGIQNSPYEYLLDKDLWLEIYDVFTHDACSLLNLSVDSPLSVCINSGCIALPALLNIKQVMQQRQVDSFLNGKEELPIEIDLGQKHRYHSVFACPILRQQSSINNPPMKLLCGHVISRDALNKLGQNVNKLKCPYCPTEQTSSDAKLIYF